MHMIIVTERFLGEGWAGLTLWGRGSRIGYEGGGPENSFK